MEIGRREDVGEGGHGRFAAEFLEIRELGFAEAVEAAGGIFDLDREGVFVGAKAFDGLAGGSGDADEEKIFGEAVGRFGQNFGQEGGAAAFADGGEVRTVRRSGAVELVASGAGAARVHFGAARGVAGDRIGGNFAQRANIDDEIGESVVVEEPAFGHDGRNAVGDEGFESVVIGSAREADAIESGAATAFAVDAMAKGAVAFEEFFSGDGIGGERLFFGGLRRRGVGGKKQQESARDGQRNFEPDSLHREEPSEKNAQCFGSVSPEPRGVNEKCRRR